MFLLIYGILKIYFLNCVCICVCAHVRIGAYGSYKEAPNLMAIELQTIVTCPTWVLGTELWDFARTMGAPSLLS